MRNSMNKEDLKREINDKVRSIDEALEKYLPGGEEIPSEIHRSMRYSIFAGGKRLRPVLCLTAAEAVGGDSSSLLPAACALELIHTYSLIHDDLPAMDNDDFRRGKPTNHKVYGEAMAILTGDALLTMAFGLIAECSTSGDITPETVIRVIREVSAAAGSQGMIGGQVVDILSENKSVDQDRLKYIHDHKTGALFKASIRTGALLGRGSEEQVESLSIFAENLGLAFQITDDILDIEGEFQKIGKTLGSDERKHKCTYPAVFGLQESKALAGKAVERALLSLRDFDGRADVLRYIAKYLLDRDR